MSTIDIGGVASWILILIIGVAMVGASNMGFLPPDMGGIGRVIVFGALGLGVIYFGMDILNKT